MPAAGAEGLVAALRDALGPNAVATGADAARWSCDWTGQLRWTPLCVARPADTAGVAAVLRAARAAGVPVVPVSGNTGLAGGTVADGAVMLSLDRMARIRAIRPKAQVAEIEAGVVLSTLHEAAAAQGLRFPMTFGARGSAMLGGMMATNAGGSGVLRYGNTRDLVLGIEAVLADGRVVDLMGALHKDNSGLNLKHLLIGSEGTLGIITAAVVRLVPAVTARATAMAAVPDFDAALALLADLQAASGGGVEAFEYMDARFMDTYAAHAPDAPEPFAARHAINILCEIASTDPAAAQPDPSGAMPLDAIVERVLAAGLEAGRVTDAVVARSDAQRDALWARREAAAEITVARKPVLICDIAVATDRVEAFLSAIAPRLAAIDPGAEPMTVAHLGDGNLHYSVWPTDARDKDAIAEAVEECVLALGGTFSAEHGIGSLKRDSMRRRKDPGALAAMRAIKDALDPDGLLNPGKLLP